MDTLTPTRRQVLVGIAGGAALVTVWPSGIAGAAPLPPGVTPVTLAEFMELSEALTDNEFSLRDEVGAQYLAALDPGDIKRLVVATNGLDTFAEILASGALDDKANAVTAQQVLVYWYSGLVNNTTADYLEALAWETIEDFAVPASTKIGFPKWAERPS